ncbi:MAG: cytochrome c3 family protein [Sulfurifustaceae bacterium]
MPQTFSPAASTLVWIGVVATVLLVFVLMWLISTIAAANARPGAGFTPAQPIPFSHQHHVAEDGIDCRYCHDSVETSAFAGIPGLNVCLTCHSQIYTDAPVLAPLFAAIQTGSPLRWQRANRLPGFVYFDHSIHVAKGVGCGTCHGRVDKMRLTAVAAPLTMQWCLNCHRNPAPNLRPKDAVFDMEWQPPRDQDVRGRELIAAYGIDTTRLTDCSVCHR